MISNSEPASADEQRLTTRSAVDDLVLVSNRQPYRHRYERDDEGVRHLTVDNPAGGLTAGIDPVMQRLDGTWIAWGDGEADFDVADTDGRVAVPPGDPSYTLQRLQLSESQVDGYYYGYANQALWPLCHSDTYRVQFDDDHWQRYQEVNQQFADAVLEHAEAGTAVWFQDYHFALAPRMVRQKEPDAFLMHFFHIPWPAADVFRICPQREELLRGLLSNDLLGFHLPRYCAQFMECAETYLDGAVIDWANGEVHYEGNTTTVQAFPLGVDADDIYQTSAKSDGTFWNEFRQEHGISADTKVAIGVDRLDYTKGIPQRLKMLERLFETRPSLRGKFTYIQKGCQSREQIPAYQRLQEEVTDAVTDLNERFGTDDWQPVVYMTEMYDRDELCALYRHSDLALVSPVRDGMNLVAKEYVASQVDDDGVLLLSPLAGAYESLGEDALTLNPYDTAGGADAIERALGMNTEQRRSRMRRLRNHVHEEDLTYWLRDVVETADRIHTERQEAR